jgi:hypothetical protein
MLRLLDAVWEKVQQEYELRLFAGSYSFILLQNLSNEPEGKGIDAWLKLMRVLTHEIMNSVTPVITIGTFLRKKTVQLKT